MEISNGRYIGSLSPILGRTRQDNRGEPHLGTLKGSWRDPNGGPEVPTNNDIAVRNLLGSTTALHLDHSTCFTTVPDEDVFFPVDYTWDTKKVCKVHCSSDKLEKPALRCQHPQTSDGTLLAVSWSMGCFGMSWVLGVFLWDFLDSWDITNVCPRMICF